MYLPVYSIACLHAYQYFACMPSACLQCTPNNSYIKKGCLHTLRQAYKKTIHLTRSFLSVFDSIFHGSVFIISDLNPVFLLLSKFEKYVWVNFN